MVMDDNKIIKDVIRIFKLLVNIYCVVGDYVYFFEFIVMYM